MIRKLILVALAFLVYDAAFSQIQKDEWKWPDEHTQDMQIRIEAGAKVGGGLSFASAPTLYHFDFQSGLTYQFGIAANAHLGYRSRLHPESLSRIGLEVEALFNTKRLQTYWGPITLNCIEIPVLIQYYLVSGVVVEAGPTFVKHRNASPESLQCNEAYLNISDFRVNDVMLSIGLGYQTVFGLNLGLRYNMGTSLMAENLDSRISTIVLSASYLFPVLQ